MENNFKIRPILFNTQMVRAILEGRKTVTRRLIKPQPTYTPNGGFAWKGRAYGTDLPPTIQGAAHNFQSAFGVAPFKCGDILYVRETWSMASDILGGEAGPVYMADYSDSELAELKSKHFRWHPSLHMPKEHARIFLRVTSVQLKRLNDMETFDFLSEGILPEPIRKKGCKCQWFERGCMEKPCKNKDAYERLCYSLPFTKLWDSTLTPMERKIYGWNANPWVWVIDFERCEKPVEV